MRALQKGGGVLAVVVGLILAFEGYSPSAYVDPPGVMTICYGRTAGVTEKSKATPEQCETYLAEDLQIARAAVHRLVKRPMTPGQEAAFIDFVYNVGQGAFARSSVLREFNAGNAPSACRALLLYVYAGKKKLPGLVKRRRAEHTLCMGSKSQ